MPQVTSFGDFVKIHDELHKADDRSAAIIGGSLAEDFLDYLLRAEFPCDDEDLLRRLFIPEGPLGSFSAKIALCRMLGLIGPEGYKDLERIRIVRNKFAHVLLMPNNQPQLSTVSFATQQVADLCKALTTLDHLEVPRPTEPRERYMATCASFWTSWWLTYHINKQTAVNFSKPFVP